MLIGMAVQLNTNPTSPVQPSASSPSQTGFVLKRLPFRVGHPQPAAFPRIRGQADQSSYNWSGYAAPYDGKINGVSATEVFSGVSGSWTVTGLTGTGKTAAYAAAWVGLDGYASDTVEQTGTLQEWTGKTAQYYAWFEMYPGPMYEINATVEPGDVINASVEYVGTTTVSKGRGRSETEYVFNVTIEDVTQGWTFASVPDGYASYTTVTSAARDSAEWIVEAPASGNEILPLADFGTIDFTGCEATATAGTGTGAFVGTGPISSYFWDELTMVSKNRAETLEDSVSGLLADPIVGDDFTVSWLAQ
jgi:hypothetical protein